MTQILNPGAIPEALPDDGQLARLEMLRRVWLSRGPQGAIKALIEEEFPGSIAVASSFGAELTAAILALIAEANLFGA